MRLGSSAYEEKTNYPARRALECTLIGGLFSGLHAYMTPHPSYSTLLGDRYDVIRQNLEDQSGLTCILFDGDTLLVAFSSVDHTID